MVTTLSLNGGERTVFRVIRRQRGISRTEIAAATGLTSAAITQIVRRLMEQGWVEESEERYPALGGGGGRSRVGLQCKAGPSHVLGITVRRSDVLWGLTTFSGELVARWRSGAGPDELDATLNTIDAACRASGWDVVRIGIGFPTFCLPWDRAELMQRCETRFPGVPGYIGHNGSYAALAEDWFFGTQLPAHWLYVFFGAGVGGAVVLPADPLPPHIHSVEVGHVGVSRDGPPCFCGNRGCVEMTAAPLSLLEAAHYPPDSPFAVLHDLDATTKASAAETLGYGLMSIVNVLGVNTIVLGGMDSSPLEAVYGSVREVLRDHVTPSQEVLTVSFSAMGEWSSTVGAALAALDEIGEDMVAALRVASRI